MKRFCFLVSFIVISFCSAAQYVYQIKADSVRIHNDSCKAELILENSTRHINGFLYNKGNGRTEFRKALVKINDSIYVIGADTLKISNRLTNTNDYIQNQYATKQNASAWIDTLKVNKVNSDTLRSSNIAGLARALYTDASGVIKKLKSPIWPAESKLLYYKLPSNFLSQNIESIIKSGATASATITTVGSYDRIAVAGGDGTSQLIFNKLLSTDNDVTFKLLIKVDALGAAPVVGLAANNAGSTYTHIGIYMRVYSNILTPNVVWNGSTTSSGNWGNDGNSSNAPFASVGDVLEITLSRHAINKGFDFAIKNIYNGKTIIKRRVNGNLTGMDIAPQYPSLILADGTYTILDFEVINKTGITPKIMTIGDDLFQGYNLPYTAALEYKLSTAIPYRVGSACAEGVNMAAMADGTVRELNELQPEMVIISNYYDAYMGRTVPASSEYSKWVSDFTKVIKTIKSYGGIPVIIKYANWPYTNQQYVDAFNSFLEANKTALGFEILDITGETYTYTSWYHYDEVMIEKTKNKIVMLAQSKGIL